MRYLNLSTVKSNQNLPDSVKPYPYLERVKWTILISADVVAAAAATVVVVVVAIIVVIIGAGRCA